jgi:hypothetical protein
MPGPTLQLNLNDYNALIDARAKAEQELAVVHAELLAAKIADPSGRLPAITTFARECLTIARFAIANLPPEMIRGWPYQALRNVCNTIDILPDYSADDRDMALDLLNFAKDCEDHAIRRSTEPKATKMTNADIEEHRQRIQSDPIAMGLIAKMQEQA